MKQWITDRVGIVRLRQIVEDLTHRLAFLPIAFVVLAVVASQVTLSIDRGLGDVDLPAPLATSVDSARPVFGAIAGGLITAVTLLLSMMLVAVQLASANFSPRTLRNWLGDRTLRRSVAVVLATTVYCLLGLRGVRTTADTTVNPTVTVLIAVLLGLVSLVAVIRAVDHVTRSMQVGAVAHRLTDETIATLNATRERLAGQRPDATPTAHATTADRLGPPRPDDTAEAVESVGSGWVQQIDEGALAAALPDDATAWIAVVHGDYVTHRSPLAWVLAEEPIDDAVRARVQAAFALGRTRTMQQDIGFGLGQLSDIAVRALSPGVNDPETANGILVHLGQVLLEVWADGTVDETVERDGRTIHRVAPSHEDLLRAALDEIRRHARSEPAVLLTMARTLRHLRAEVERRHLPGPLAPIDDFLDDIARSADDGAWLERERRDLALAVDPGRPVAWRPA